MKTATEPEPHSEKEFTCKRCKKHVEEQDPALTAKYEFEAISPDDTHQWIADIEGSAKLCRQCAHEFRWDWLANSNQFDGEDDHEGST